MARSPIQNYEDAVNNGRPTKRVRDVGEVPRLGVVGAQIYRPAAAKPATATVVKASPFIAPASSIRSSSTAAPARVPMASSSASQSAASAAQVPSSAPTSPFMPSAPYAVSAGAGGSSSSDTEDTSSSPDDSSAPLATFAPPNPSLVSDLDDDALAAGVARLAARGVAVGPIIAQRISVDAAPVSGLGEISPTTVNLVTLAPLAIFVGLGVAAVGYGTWRRRKARR